jgi:hypothetical protein
VHGWKSEIRNKLETGVAQFSAYSGVTKLGQEIWSAEQGVGRAGAVGNAPEVRIPSRVRIPSGFGLMGFSLFDATL